MSALWSNCPSWADFVVISPCAKLCLLISMLLYCGNSMVCNIDQKYLHLWGTVWEQKYIHLCTSESARVGPGLTGGCRLLLCAWKSLNKTCYVLVLSLQQSSWSSLAVRFSFLGNIASIYVLIYSCVINVLMSSRHNCNLAPVLALLYANWSIQKSETVIELLIAWMPTWDKALPTLFLWIQHFQGLTAWCHNIGSCKVLGLMRDAGVK
jgi:hypothetical protein